MNYWLRFGLPIGSAFVTAVILDNIIACDWLLKETILASANDTVKSSIDSYDYQFDQYPAFYVFVRAILSVLLWIILVKTPKTYLFIWIIGAVTLDALRHGNMKMIFDAISSFNLYLFILMPLIRAYLYLIFIESARIIEKQKEPRLLVGSYEGADEDLQSLVPIGYDTVGMWKYYLKFHVLGTRVLLTVDLVWTFLALPAIKAALGGFAGLVMTLLGFGVNGYCLGSIIQKQPNGVVMWRLLYFIFLILMMIAFGSEFLDTRDDPTEQGIICTLTLAIMLIFKIFLYWFSTGVEDSMGFPDDSTNADNQIAQLENTTSEVSFQDTEGGEWAVAPLTPLSGRVVITEIEGRDSRTGWDARSGRTSRTSRVSWGSQPGISIATTREVPILHRNPSRWGSQPGLRYASSYDHRDIRPGWGSQSIMSDSRTGGESFRSGVESQPQSANTSREAVSVSTISSVSGWTTAASGRNSRSDMT